jgi:glutaconate CoA-transferase, subunit B
MLRDWTGDERAHEMLPYTNLEMMAISAGRMISDGDVVFAGTGVSMLAATVAKRIHAPKSVVFFETGGIDPSLDELPLAVADPRVMAGTALNTGLIEAFSILGHRRLRTIAFLGAAQIDRYGNLNSTVLGDYEHPKTRFPGSGGACDAASLAWGVIIFMQHEKRRFVEKLDYLTSPGWLCGGNTRDKAGFTRGGPMAVVTNLGIMRFDGNSKAMYLSETYAGIRPNHVAENTGFDLDVSLSVEASPPTDEELRILRTEVDPQRLILG